MTSEKQLVREFLEGLSIAELKAVMDSPFEPLVMECVEDSQVLTKMVTQVLDDEPDKAFAELPDAGQVSQLMTRLQDKFAEASEAEKEAWREFNERVAAQSAPQVAKRAIRDRLLDALQRFQVVPTLIEEWIDAAIANAALFSQGIAPPDLGTARFETPGQKQIPKVFRKGDISVQLDKRDELELFVVEVESANEADYEREIKIVLFFGGTNAEVTLSVTLAKRKGGKCFGTSTVDIKEIEKLGPFIIPVVEDS